MKQPNNKTTEITLNFFKNSFGKKLKKKTERKPKKN